MDPATSLLLGLLSFLIFRILACPVVRRVKTDKGQEPTPGEKGTLDAIFLLPKLQWRPAAPRWHSFPKLNPAAAAKGGQKI